MPALQSHSGATVLVNGASGYVGTHTITQLLKDGFKVRAGVRSKEKGEYVLGVHQSTDVTYVVVPDMIEPGAYDEAVVGVEGVVHSVTGGDLIDEGDPQATIEPAIKGTLNLLKAAQECGPTIKRILLIGSVAAVGGFGPGPKTLTDDDWNDGAVELVNQGSRNGYDAYAASKVLSERAFWDFIKTEKPDFDGVVTLPGGLVGAPTHFGDNLVGAMQMIGPWLIGPTPEDQRGLEYHPLVHDTDVALANVLSLTTPNAGGERFLLVAERLFANDVLLLAEQYPELKDRNLTKGNSDKAFREGLLKTTPTYDGSRAPKVLGFEYKSVEKALADTIKASLPQLLKR